MHITYTQTVQPTFHSQLRDRQWHRSVVKYGGSGSVRSSHQTVSDYTLRQWLPNTPTIPVPGSL